MATAAQVVVERCLLHPQEDINIHCFDCNVDTCELCFQTPAHHNHKWGSISRLRKRKRAEVIAAFDKAREEVSAFKMKMTDAKDTTEKQREMIKKEIQKIEIKEESLKDQVRCLASKLKKVCEDKQSKRDCYLNEVSENYESIITEYKELRDTFEMEKSKASDDEMIALGRRLDEVLQRVGTFTSDRLKAEKIGFIEGQTQLEGDTMFGRLQIKSPNIRATEKSRFKFGKGRVSCIVPVESGAWMRNHGAPYIKLISQEGEEKASFVTNKGVSAFIMVKDTIIFTEYKNKFIGRIFPDQTKEVLVHTAPAGLGGLCLDIEDPGSFYVCFTDNTTVTPTDFVDRSIVKMTMTGNMMQKIEFHKGKRLFNHPYRVCQNYNTNLCVVDRTNWDAGIVQVLQTDGELRFLYRGLNSPLSFNPCSVACDETCRIIISDCRNNSVHVLDEDGVFLKFLLNKDNGITSPWSLALRDDKLWIGNDSSLVTVYNLEEMCY